MNLIIKLPKIFLALLFACIAVSAAQAAWTVDITSPDQLEPAIFGYDLEATDGEFDPAFEVLTTYPINGKVIFSLDSLYAKKIKKDDLSWTLTVTVPSDGTEVSWNTSLVPENIKLLLTKDTTVINMKGQSSLTFQKGASTYTITAEVQEIPVLTSVNVTPSEAALKEGEDEQFSAKGYDQNGAEMTGLTFTWSSSNTTVGTIDSSSGEFTANKAGTTTISVTSGEVTGTAQVTVTLPPPELTSITVTPPEVSVEKGKTQQFTANCYDQYGAKMSAIHIFWSSQNVTIGYLDADGLFTASNAGIIKVFASSGNISGEATVTVTLPPPELTTIVVTPSEASVEEEKTQQFTATGKDQYGNEMSGLTFTWSSSNTTVGTIDSSSGEFTASKAGTTTVSATSGEVTGTAQVTVTPLVQSDVILSLPDLQLKKFQSGIIPLTVENITDGEGILATVTWDSKIIRVESINVNESVFGNLSLTCNLTENSATIQVIDPGKFNAASPAPFADIVYKAMGKKNGYTDLTICDASWSSSFNKYECCCDSGSVTITGIKGDFNNNNEIDIGDSSKVAYMVAGKTDVDSEADFNGKKGVDTGDAAMIAWYLIGKIPTL